jgi:tRNA dimethylallyltransferase
VRERYSVGRYAEDAARALADARARNLLPIIVGGTGLYFSVLMEGLSPIPPVPADVRLRVRSRFEAMGREAFIKELARHDPDSTARLASGDTQRILRAADVWEATGLPLSRWQKVAGQPVLARPSLAKFVLAPPRELLWERIDRRFVAMLEHGALAEARALMDLDPTLPAARALGIPDLLRHLHGEIGLPEAAAAAQLATRQYVKRQVTWFRKRMADWKWRHDDDISNFVTNVQQYVS